MQNYNLAAREDEDCDAYVASIPYYDKPPDVRPEIVLCDRKEQLQNDV